MCLVEEVVMEHEHYEKQLQQNTTRRAAADFAAVTKTVFRKSISTLSQESSHNLNNKQISGHTGKVAVKPLLSTPANLEVSVHNNNYVESCAVSPNNAKLMNAIENWTLGHNSENDKYSSNDCDTLQMSKVHPGQQDSALKVSLEEEEDADTESTDNNAETESDPYDDQDESEPQEENLFVNHVSNTIADSQDVPRGVPTNIADAPETVSSLKPDLDQEECDNCEALRQVSYISLTNLSDL